MSAQVVPSRRTQRRRRWDAEHLTIAYQPNDPEPSGPFISRTVVGLSAFYASGRTVINLSIAMSPVELSIIIACATFLIDLIIVVAGAMFVVTKISSQTSVLAESNRNLAESVRGLSGSVDKLDDKLDGHDQRITRLETITERRPPKT